MSQGFTRGIPIDTDGTLSANSDSLIPSQKAVKTYADTVGTPTGGTTGQVLEKVDGTDYNTQWATPSGLTFQQAFAISSLRL